MEGFDYKSIVPEFNGEYKNLDRLEDVRSSRARDISSYSLGVLAREGANYHNWEELKQELKHRFKVPTPEKAVRKALEILLIISHDVIRESR